MVKQQNQGYCNECAKNVNHLPNHRRDVHDEKTVFCGYCNKTVRRDHLRRHTDRQHHGFQPMERFPGRVCPHCYRDFCYSSDEFYENHIINCIKNPASDFQQRAFRCNFCAKKFGTTHNLMLHTVRRHESQAPEQGEPATETEITSFNENSADIQELFVKTKEHGKVSRRFIASEKTVKFRLTELALRLCRAGLILPVVAKVLTHLIDLGKYDPDSLIAVTIDSPGLDHGHTSGLQKVKHFQSDLFLMDFEKIINSSDIIRLQNDKLSLEIRNIDLRTAVAGPGKKLKVKDFADVTEFLRRKSGLADPEKLELGPNLQESCFIVSVAMCLYGKDRDLKQMKFYRHGKFPAELEQMVCQIYSGISVDIDTPISTDHYGTINNYLQREHKRNLVVYDISDESSKIQLLYKGKPCQPNPIPVLSARGHCWLITKLNLFFTTKGYCSICYTPLENKAKYRHQCVKKCSKCLTKQCAMYNRQKPTIACHLCYDCNGFFVDTFCLNQHRQLGFDGASCCSKFKRCRACGKRVKTINILPQNHHCLMSKCFNCQQWVDMNHQCYLKAPAERMCVNNNTRLLYFDLETRETADGYLVPFIFCLIQTCNKCANDVDGDLFSFRDCCQAERTKTWIGDDCMKDACKYIFFNQKLSGSVLIAHNLSGFDGFFIYETLVSMGQQPIILTRANRILSLQCGLNVKCICSLSFFHCKLEKLPKIFGLHCEKQFLPLKLLKNLDPTKNIKGWIPPPDVWQPELMSAERRVQFQEHYAELLTSPHKFDFFNMLKFYCIMDTKILYQSCQCFREMLIRETNVCPFTSGCITLTALTTKVWKKNFLDFDRQTRLTSVALIPDIDLKEKLQDNQSLLARCYISWLEIVNSGIRIDYAGNGREYRIGNKRVDALMYDVDGKPSKIIEVNGCFWHAHGDCELFPDQKDLDVHPIFKPLRWIDVQSRTLFRQKELEDESLLTTNVVYECEILRQVRDDPEMAAHFEKYKANEQHKRPLNPREALYGGRVTQGILAVQLSDHQIDNEQWEISHFDLNSLYPTVMAENHYPEGHPIKLDGSTLKDPCHVKTLEKYFGIIHCRILAPKDVLLYPPLPLRVRDRLTFPLCRTCAEEQDHSQHCTHNDDDRSWVGTYCTPELLNAIVEYGYEVLEVYQIWHFEKKNNNLFRSFVNHWAALKFRSSGFPDDVKTQNQKEHYVKTINDNYGCQLETTDIVFNEGMRNVAKLLSNSLWGRLGLSSSKSSFETKLLVSQYELKQLMSIPGIKTCDARIVGTDKLLVTLQKSCEYIPTEDRQSNIVIAAFTLSYARMVLQEMLNKVDYNTCYTDTDSIIFLHRRGSHLVPKETFLYGGWKKETPENHIIRSWCCLGPKVYAYKTAEVDPQSGMLVVDGESKTVLKAKGLQMECRKAVGLDEMNAVLENQLKFLIEQQHDEQNTQIEKYQKLSIVVPDPTMRRNLMTDPKGVIKTYPDRVKNLNFSLTKRQYLHMPNDQLSVHRTIPWGLRFDCS